MVETYIGKFNTGIPKTEYHFAEKPGVEEGIHNAYPDGRYKKLKSYLTGVRFIFADGREEMMAPITMESCMTPGIVNVIPVTYEEIYNSDNVPVRYSVSTPYKYISVKVTDKRGADTETGDHSRIKCEEIQESDILKIETVDYIPHLQKNSCDVCRNCGRC